MSDLYINNIGLLATPEYKNRDELQLKIRQIPQAAILIKDGRIAQIGEQVELDRIIPKSVPVLDAQGQLALPGFIDCHTHPVFVGNRAKEFHLRNAGKSYQEIAAAGGGIHASARLVKNETVEQIVAESLPRFKSSLSFGVTTIEGKSGYGLDWENEEKLLLALGEISQKIPQKLHKTFLIHALPESAENDREKFVNEVVQQMIPAVSRQNLASAVDTFCEVGAFTPEESKKFLLKAKELGLQTTIHANQFGHSGGVKIASEIQTRSADHLEFLNEEEMNWMIKSEVIAVILPACVFFLRTIPYPPVRKMIEKGLRVAIATDMNPGSSMTESLPFCMTTAAIHCHMTPEELLWGVTLNPASVLGVQNEVGSLEINKSADITLWPLKDIESLCYYFGNLHPNQVLIDGKQVFNQPISVS